MLGYLVIISLCYLILRSSYIVFQNMPRRGSLLFKIGYSLYTGTRLGLAYHLRQIKKAHRIMPSSHSQELITQISKDVDVISIPIIEDNYSYLIWNKSDNSTILLDPSDAPTVINYVIRNKLPEPVAVLTTHKHWDHAGGNVKIKNKYPSCQVYGSEIDKPWGTTHYVKHDVILKVGSMNITPIHTPGHTTGHISYLVEGPHPPILFTGDLLFVGGIGRMFEGDARQMLNSLDNICKLSDATYIFPGHEYALHNLKFGNQMDPDNLELKEKLEEVRVLRDNKLGVIPSRLAEEKKYNIFLRTHDSNVGRAVGIISELNNTLDLDTRIAVLDKLRSLKDKFKPSNYV